MVEQDAFLLTLGWFMRDRLQSLVYITEGSGAILQRASASASAINEEAARQLVSLGVEHGLTNYLTYISHRESGSAPFWGASSHAVTKQFGNFQATETHSWTGS